MWIELFGHTTYILLAVSYLVRDIVWLRRIAIPASICSIIFNYFAPAEPLWLIINWNVFFLVINISQLLLIHWNDRVVRLNPELSELAEFLSPPLSATDVLRMEEWGDRITCESGTELCVVGNRPESLYLLLDGTVAVYRAGERLGECSRGTLLGEISFLTGKPCSATVIIEEGSATLYRWNQKALKKRISNYPALKSSIQQCLATHLSKQFTSRELEHIGA
ncbi:MAG: cyclic nucleotide-binding domain-containing protein [Planctomycetota bacterium]